MNFSDTLLGGALETIFVDLDPQLLSRVGTELSNGEILLPRSCTTVDKFSRIAMQTVSANCPSPLRSVLLGLFHRIRPPKPNKILRPGQCAFNRLVGTLAMNGAQLKGYNGKRFAICLSYDVDTSCCHGYLPNLLELLAQRNLVATFHLLTHWEYELNFNIVEDTRKNGHEVALHGASHDVALGYRSSEKIKRELSRAIDMLGEQPASYRAPALCMTETLMHILMEQNFLIDSSLPMSSMYYPSVESCFPYPLDSTGGFWELPVLLQDTTLFMDLRLSEEDALAFLKENLAEVRNLGGVAVLNFHPVYANRFPWFQEKVLDYIAELPDAAVFTHKQVVQSLAD